ncbi:MAG TPA: 1-acyl-sn-glycerol-3-phosphate acyltransferase [Candidatus Acidoferrum sp.]|nr:1-acyl-sn-glycerol-3-phosphate acyltransferase [Candidatus Acidoferrum sp.]
MHEFDDIRPYRDHEVSGAVHGLLEDLELSRAMAKFHFPRAYRWFPGPVARLVQSRLRQQLLNANSIHDVQVVIEKYLDRLIETTTNGLTHSGLDRLDPKMPYLFISNHRDITMDPALVNYMLYHQDFDTLQIAIGDNLLKRPFLTKLMKLNKSFLVKRGLQGRDKLAASKQLSGYISHCIATGQNVWIAQREGRAKDGLDQTESAIIKMLHMAGRDSGAKLSLATTINALHVVPVAISYEYDPCDVAKATELHAVATEGKFVKDENSDVQSILTGMIGWKGAVHVSFGTPLQMAEGTTAEQVVEAIDHQIICNYQLHASNLAAWYLLQPRQEPGVVPAGVDPQKWSVKQAEFLQRLQAAPEQLRPYLLHMYANPVQSRQALRQQ